MIKFCDDCDSLILREFGNNCRVCNNSVILPKLSSRTYEIILNKRSTTEESISRGAKIDQKCNKCGSEQMYYKVMQTRSADEGQTIFFECDCGNKFKVNS